MKGIPLINGVAHAYADIKMPIMGVAVGGITAISYSQEREKQDNRGMGDVPVSRGYGPRRAEASITMLAESVAILEAGAPNRDITMYPPFDIPVVFVPEGSTNITTHVIKNFEFTKNGRDTKTGDMGIEVQLPGICSHVNF